MSEEKPLNVPEYLLIRSAEARAKHLGISVEEALAEIKEESMEPSLHEGDYVLAVKVSEPLNRGDIVIYEYTPKNIEIIKRVIGLPGETISNEDGVIKINGKTMNDTWGNGESVSFEATTLQEDEIFVLGDNRQKSSSDSSSIGAIKVEDCWKLRYLYWPYHKFKSYE